MAVSPSANRLDFTPIRCNCLIDYDIACYYIVIIFIFTMGSHHISQNIFDNNCLLLNLVSYNLHGINQGFPAIRDIIASHNPDIFLLQEHWLTPDNLSTFSRLFPDYFHYGTSAMSSDVSRGVLRGRPYGGVSFLISNKLIAITTCIASCERYAVIKVNNCLIINVYLPCK